jgi:flagellar hook-length control protein FliK
VVKHSTIILRQNNGGGELRLVLKPEALGNVRVRLTMASGRLEGQIIVENNTVRELFESALPGIQSGLREEGFSATSLQVSVGHREADGRQQNGRGPAEAQAAEEFESTVPELAFGRVTDGVVDLLV